MTERHPVEILSAYLDGEVTTAERLEVAHHLEACGECRALLEDFRTMALAAEQERPAPIPSDMAARIVSALGARRWKPRRFFSFRSPLPVAVAAGLLVVVTATWVVVQRRGEPEPMVFPQVVPTEEQAPEISPAPKATMEARPLERITVDDRARHSRRATMPAPASDAEKGGSAAGSAHPAAPPASLEKDLLGDLRSLGYVGTGEEASPPAAAAAPQKTRTETDAAAPAERAPAQEQRKSRAALHESGGRSIEFELSGAKGSLTEAGLVTFVRDGGACSVDLGASPAASGEVRTIFRMASASSVSHAPAPGVTAKEDARPGEAAAGGSPEPTDTKEKERQESLRLIRVMSDAPRPILAANVAGVEDRLRHLLDVTARDLIQARCGEPAVRPPAGD